MKKQAIIKDVGFGLRDVGRPVLWFYMKFKEGLSSLQVLGLDETVDLLGKCQLSNILELEDRVCWAEIKNGATHIGDIKFLELDEDE